MKRTMLIALMVLVSLMLTAQASASGTSSRAFERFEHQVCSGASKQEREAGPVLLRFNNIFYNSEHTSENLEAAGREYRHVNQIWSKWSDRLLAIPASPGKGQLWHRYGVEQEVVLRLGFDMAAALEAADLPAFNRALRKSVKAQIKRNKTWDRIGFVC